MNRQKKEELKPANQQQGDRSQQQGQKSVPGQQSQQSGQEPSKATKAGGQQEAFRPTDTD